MSLKQGFVGASSELKRCPTVAAKLCYTARATQLVVQEILGTLALVPFAARSALAYRRLQKRQPVRYGASERNLLDIYTPPQPPPTWRPRRPGGAPTWVDSDAVHAPVALFVHGGVWASGERWQYALLARALAERGVVVCVVAYTLYPAANVDTMVREVCDATTWVLDHIGPYGGNASRLTLLGHSAGAHLIMMSLLHRARALRAAAARGDDSAHLDRRAASRTATNSSPLQAHGLAEYDSSVHEGKDAIRDDGRLCTNDVRMPCQAVLMAGVYDVQQHYEFEAARGVHMLSTMERAFGGWARLRARSPAAILAHAVAAAAPQAADAQASGVADGIATGVPVSQRQGGAFDAWGAVDRSSHDMSTEAATQSGMRQRGAPAAQLDRPPPPPPPVAVLPPSLDVGSVRAARGVVPPDFLLDPPQREHAVAQKPQDGAHLARRAAGAAADTHADGPRMPARPPLSEHADDAAERLAAGITLEDVCALPPCVLMSGTADLTVPWYESTEMAHALHAAGANARLLMYNRVSHADWVVAWPPGRPKHGYKRFHDDLIALVTESNA